MSTRVKLTNVAARIFTLQLNQTLPATLSRPNSLSPDSLFDTREAMPVPVSTIIDMPPTAVPTDSAILSNYLHLGRAYHPLCRNAFVEKRIIGYYHYERRVEYRTCALAAAYAGAFGPESIERPDFSYSMAVWRLSQKVGYDLNQRMVYGPTGRYQPIAEEMMHLVDKDSWTREGLVDWLQSLRL